MSPDPTRAERVIAADTSATDEAEARILASLARVATSLDAAEEALVIPPRPATDWIVRDNAAWWLAAARFEEQETDAVRFLSSALGRWDDRGELYMRATPDDVAAALTEWYLAREAA